MWRATVDAAGAAHREGMNEMRRAVLLLLFAAAVAACSDGAGNSLSTGIGGTVRAEYGRVSR